VPSELFKRIDDLFSVGALPLRNRAIEAYSIVSLRWL